MATGTTTKRGADRWFVIDTDWAGYKAMQKIRGDRSNPRIIYLDGRMTLVSPSYSHEVIRMRLGTLIQEVVFGLGIAAIFAGSTTLRSRPRRGGVEGDWTYYFANADKIRGKKRIDMEVDPPPDLAVEAVVTHPVKDAVEIYRRLKVPEVWVCDGRKFHILILQEDGTYKASTVSASLPMLSAETLLKWVQHLPDADITEWGLEVRQWVVDELAPRHRAGERLPDAP